MLSLLGGRITFGARVDSYYEYLFKRWLQLGASNPAVMDLDNSNKLREMFEEAMVSMQQRLIRYSHPNKYMYVGEIESNGVFTPKMDHLVCFLPGILALAHHHGLKAIDYK